MTLSPGAKVQPNLSTLRSPAGFNAAWSSMLRERAPDAAAVHWAEDLDITDWIETKAARDAGLPRCCSWTLSLCNDEGAIAVSRLAGGEIQSGEFSAISVASASAALRTCSCGTNRSARPMAKASSPAIRRLV